VIRPLIAFVVLLPVSSHAFAEQAPTFLVVYEEPALEPLAKRLRAELRSAGRDEVVIKRRIPLGRCVSRPAGGEDSGQVGVLLKVQGEGAVSAEICTNPQIDQLTVVTARGHLDEEADFAIVVTEALHGILTAPTERNNESSGGDSSSVKESRSASESPRELESPRSSVTTSFSVDSRLVFDVPTGGVWLGVVPGIQLPFTQNFGFGAEVFLGFHPIEYSDDEIELESHLVWARFGLLGSASFGPVLLGWNVSAGPFANRATAYALPPRQGGSDGAFGAIIQAGGLVEFPARGRFFLRGSLGVSTLVPRLNYQMSEGTTSDVGELLLEGGLGLGIRFGQPGAANGGP
jgi:hypothetical protein